MTAHKHTAGQWCIYQHVDRDQSVKQIGEKLPDGRLGELVAANVPVRFAALIRSAPILFSELERLTKVFALYVDVENTINADIAEAWKGAKEALALATGIGVGK